MSGVLQKYFDLRQLSLQFKLGDSQCQMLGWGIYRGRPWRNFLHSHSFFEICFVHAGTGTFKINEQVFELKRGDLLIARPGEVHEIISAETVPLGIYFWSFILNKPQRNDRTAMTELVSMFLQGGEHIVSRPRIEGLLDMISSEITNRQPGFQIALYGMFHKLQIDTLRATTPAVEVTSAYPSDFETGSPIANDIIQFLQDNLARPLRLRDVAAQVFLSERHINRLFKLAYGHSVMAHLLALRLAEAKRLLLRADLSISEIAAAVGIEDARYFTTIFRKNSGHTPTEFRKLQGTFFVDSAE